jgi:hypothetical protein
MMGNLVRVAKRKSKELRPRGKNLNGFGSKRVGVKKRNAYAYDI